MKDMVNFLFNKAPTKLLMGINAKDNYLSKVLKHEDITRGRSDVLIQYFIKERLITIRKEGRCVYFSLTSKGKRLRIYLVKINNLLLSAGSIIYPKGLYS